MSGNKKPRKAYRPRQIAINTLEIALHQAAKPTQADLRAVIQPVEQCVRALREGVATEGQWAIVAGAVQMALSIERQGIVRGLIEHLQTTEQALQTIYRRAMASGQWKATALYYQELDALQAFTHLHKFQIAQLGRREFVTAINGAERKVRKDGHVPTLVHGDLSQVEKLGVAA